MVTCFSWHSYSTSDERALRRHACSVTCSSHQRTRTLKALFSSSINIELTTVLYKLQHVWVCAYRIGVTGQDLLACCCTRQGTRFSYHTKSCITIHAFERVCIQASTHPNTRKSLENLLSAFFGCMGCSTCMLLHASYIHLSIQTP